MSATLPPIVQAYLDAYNRRDAGALANCVTEDVVFENVTNVGPPLKVEGRAAFSALAAQTVELFIERRQTIRTAVVAHDNVAVEVDWTGTPAADVGNLKAGVPVIMRGATFFTIFGGRLSRIVDLS